MLWALGTLAVSLLPRAVLADGGFIGNPEALRAAGVAGVASAAQKAVMIGLPEGREALLLETTYHGPTNDFVWIIPVPGLPAKDDVFEASPEFIDRLLESVRPRVITTVNGRRVYPPGPHGGLGGGLGPEAVTVHERMAVGIYDVAVLSTRVPGALEEWLTENGYRLPDGSGPVLDEYVHKRWCFVALKVQPKAVGGQRVLSDVEPIGIQFRTDKLVYPLTISRISSRQKTALLLFALAQSDVECDQLPEVEPPVARALPPGTSYARIRRGLVESGAPGLIRECTWPYWVPAGGIAYEKRVGTTPPKALEPSDDWRVTRWWTILDRDAMVDLTFSPRDGAPTGRVTVVREAEVEVGPRERLWSLRGDPLGEALTTLDGTLLRFRRQYGCWPARLQDMVGRDLPEAGVDSSGNPVPLPVDVPWHGPLGPGPLLRELPVDPLTGRSDTWVYEPTGDPMIDSGGYAITLHFGITPW